MVYSSGSVLRQSGDYCSRGCATAVSRGASSSRGSKSVQPLMDGVSRPTRLVRSTPANQACGLDYQVSLGRRVGDGPHFTVEAEVDGQRVLEGTQRLLGPAGLRAAALVATERGSTASST